MTELLLRLGSRNLIVALDDDLPGDTIACATATLPTLIRAAETAPQSKNGATAPAKASMKRGRAHRAYRKPWYSFNLPPAAIENIRQKEPVGTRRRQVFELLIVDGLAATAVARKMGVHPTHLTRMRRDLEGDYDLTRFRKNVR